MPNIWLFMSYNHQFNSFCSYTNISLSIREMIHLLTVGIKCSYSQQKCKKYLRYGTFLCSQHEFVKKLKTLLLHTLLTTYSGIKLLLRVNAQCKIAK